MKYSKSKIISSKRSERTNISNFKEYLTRRVLSAYARNSSKLFRKLNREDLMEHM